MLYQGSQKETRRAKVAGPATRYLGFRAFRRCRDFPARLGAGQRHDMRRPCALGAAMCLCSDRGPDRIGATLTGRTGAK